MRVVVRHERSMNYRMLHARSGTVMNRTSHWCYRFRRVPKGLKMLLVLVYRATTAVRGSANATQRVKVRRFDRRHHRCLLLFPADVRHLKGVEHAFHGDRIIINHTRLGVRCQYEYQVPALAQIFKTYRRLRRWPERPPLTDWRDAQNISSSCGCGERWRSDFLPRVESDLYRWRVRLV